MNSSLLKIYTERFVLKTVIQVSKYFVYKLFIKKLQNFINVTKLKIRIVKYSSYIFGFNWTCNKFYNNAYWNDICLNYYKTTFRNRIRDMGINWKFDELCVNY